MIINHINGGEAIMDTVTDFPQKSKLSLDVALNDFQKALLDIVLERYAEQQWDDAVSQYSEPCCNPKEQSEKNHTE